MLSRLCAPAAIRLPLRHLDPSLQPRAAHPACVADVDEAPFDPLAAPPLQVAALDAPHPPSVLVNRPLQLQRLVGPDAIVSALRFGNVGSQPDGAVQF